MNDFIFIFYVISLCFNSNSLLNYLKYGINIIDLHKVSEMFKLLHDFRYFKFSYIMF